MYLIQITDCTQIPSVKTEAQPAMVDYMIRHADQT